MFPPRLPGFRGRDAELATLVAACRREPGAKLALVGSGGSGKSVLACALGHRMRAFSRGGVEWFRVGGWDQGTLLDMVAIRLRVPWGASDDRSARVAETRRRLAARGSTMIVLDNHENDRAMARFLNTLSGLPVTWVLTARRCLLGGVSVFPVVPPLATRGRSLFPAVASLTGLLRWNPLALDVANAFVTSRATTATALRDWLVGEGIEQVSVIDHEDDLPEVRLLVAWAWARLPAPARRLMTVMAHLEGDHADMPSLVTLARAGAAGRAALAGLIRWRLVQEPLSGRFALHATVRAAVRGRAGFDAARAVEHYVRLLERDPRRLELEQTHLFGAMDHAHTTSDLELALRIDRLLRSLGLA